MAKTTLTFSGKSKWAKVYKPDGKFSPDDPKYSIDVALSMEDFMKFKSFKVRNDGKPEDGKMWVTFRRKSSEGKPTIVDKDGNAFDKNIGNGSDVTVKILIEDFESKKYGKLVRSRLEAVRVDNLVEYVPEEAVAGIAMTGTTPPETTRPKILF